MLHSVFRSNDASEEDQTRIMGISKTGITNIPLNKKIKKVEFNDLE